MASRIELCCSGCGRKMREEHSGSSDLRVIEIVLSTLDNEDFKVGVGLSESSSDDTTSSSTCCVECWSVKLEAKMKQLRSNEPPTTITSTSFGGDMIYDNSSRGGKSSRCCSMRWNLMRSVYRFLRKISTILYSGILPQAIYSDPSRGPRGNEIPQAGQPIAFLAIISRFPRGWWRPTRQLQTTHSCTCTGWPYKWFLSIFQARLRRNNCQENTVYSD
jgi:hypothetical protein